MKFRKLFILSIALMFLMTGVAFATDDCNGDPECSASGNFSINTLAIGGGADLHGATIPNGAAGGLSAAGGVAFGAAEGSFSSFKIWGYTVTLGGAEADLTNIGGGWVLMDDAGKLYNPVPDADKSIGVYSRSNTYAVTGGSLHVGAWGLAGSAGAIGGLAGQASLDGSIIGPSPKFGWESKGVSFGVAGQGSVGGFVGGAGAVFLGSADVDALIEMNGWSGSASYRYITWNDGAKTEGMRTDVLARTQITSSGNASGRGAGGGFIEGGWVAGGVAASKTVQMTGTGYAAANAVGTYSASGELGCDFNGSAVGYTRTSATTREGYNGSVMTSSAGMKVTSGTIQGGGDPQ